MRKKDRKKNSGGLGLGGILKGVMDLLESLGDLAETGEEITKTGRIEGSDKDLKGVFGFSVKVGLGGEGVEVQPFGNIRRDDDSGETVVEEICEPIVDVLEEEDHTLVVAEIPGIGEQDVRLDVRDDVMTIYAEKGKKKYRKEVLLPKAYLKEKMVISCNNGILEIRCFA